MRRSAIVVAVLVSGWALSARAETFPNSINQPPQGPGTAGTPPGSEVKSWILPSRNRVVPGPEVSGQIGGGFGFALGARAGYNWDMGIYTGVNFTHMWGVERATVVGDERKSQNFLMAEVGYKIYPITEIEIRPYIDAGFAWFNEFHEDIAVMESKTGFGTQAGLLGAYHFGPAFVSAEGRVLITPTPVHVAAFGGLGLAL